MKTLRIWIFQTGEPLHCDLSNVRKMRAVNLADALILRGHKVVIWSSAFYHQKKSHRSKDFRTISYGDQLQICLIPSRGYASNIGLARLLDHAQLAINLKSALTKAGKPPDIAFIGYPPIEFAVVATAWLKKNKVPTIIDCKDQWPNVFVEAAPKVLRPLATVIFYPYHLLGKYALVNASAISSMSESFLDWALKYCGRKRNKFDAVLPLSPAADDIPSSEIDMANLWWSDRGVFHNGAKRFFFVGSLSRAFNFDPIIQAAQMADDQNLGWQFVVCGDGENLDLLKQKTSKLKNVFWPGWVDRPKICALASCSIAGLAPYRNWSDFQKSIPNKILDYLSLGKPVITPLSGEVAELILSENSGLIYDENVPDSCFKALLEIANNLEVKNEISQNALNLFSKKYSGSKVYGEFVLHMEKLALI